MRRHVITAAKVLRIGLICAALAAAQHSTMAEDKEFSCRAFRHTHYFLIWNTAAVAPRVTLECLLFGKYPDYLRYQIISSGSEPLVKGELEPGQSLTLGELQCFPRYLIYADPGYNGALVSVDRPYAIVCSRKRPMGLNRPSGYLYLYVPRECDSFSLTARCDSPREGARVVVRKPDGSVAGELEGEMDEAATIVLSADSKANAGEDGAVWSVEFLPPLTANTGLDDVSILLDGQLPLVLTPRPNWAKEFVSALKPGDGG